MKLKYWYKTTVIFCPVCCRESKYRERKFSKKPDDYNERTVIREVYDWCQEQ